MDPVDYCSPEHSSAIAEILGFLEWPHRNCILLGKAREALIRLQLSAGDIYDAAAAHLASKLPLYSQLQTMYEVEPTLGYVICPLWVQGDRKSVV